MPLMAQGQAECKAMLTRTVEAMKKIRADRFAMEYAVHTTFRNDPDDGPQETDRVIASIYIAGSKSKFVSEEMELFKDDSVQVSVMKDEKKIIIMRPIGTQFKEVQKLTLTILQDSLITWLTVTNCETVCYDNDPNSFVERIETKLRTPQLMNETGILKVLYWIDRKEWRISRIKVFYRDHPYDVQEIDLTISKYDTDYRGEAFRGKAYNLVFSSRNELLPKYRGYSVVDYRKKNDG